MTVVEDIEKKVSTLSERDLSNFRNWFYEFDSVFWDSEIEKAVHSGKFDTMAETALKEYGAGLTSLI